MRRIPSGELGNYVLEVGGVIIGVVALIAGATDVAKIFQARSAVRAAVQEGARCLYPTDADCVTGASTVLSAPARSFDVWVWGAGYQVERESYVASATWQQEQVLEVPVQRDQIVDVTLEQQQFQYRPYSVLYPVTSHTPYFLQTRYLPVVAGGRPFDPFFVDPVSRRIAHPQDKYVLTTVDGSTTRRVSGSINSEFHSRLKIGSFSFSVGGAWPTAAHDLSRMASLPPSVRSNLSCYGGAAIAGVDGPVLNWEAPRHSCRYRLSDSNSTPVMAGGALRVPLIVRVAGSTSGTSTNGEGKVTLAMSWTSPTGGSGYRELGGRVFKDLGSGDFIPRGLALSDIDESLQSGFDSYGDELKAHFELPLVPTDATVTIEFFLMSLNGRRVEWTGELVEVWYPEYRFVHERHNCGYSSNPAMCVTPRIAVPATHNSISEGAPFRADAQGADSCSLVEDSGAERDVTSVLGRLQESARQGVPVQPFSFRLRVPTESGVCAPKVTTQACQYQGEEYLKGCAQALSKEDVAQACGVVSPPGTMIAVKDYSQRTTTTTARRMRACSDASIPQCAQQHSRQVASARYFGDARCAGAQTVTTPPTTVGPLYVNSCETRTTSIQELYRREHAVPQDVSISVVRLPAAPVFSAEAPAGACVPHYPADSSRELLCGEGLSAKAAEACCKASGQRCRKQEIVRPSDQVVQGGTGAILTTAEQRVVSAVQVAYPPARHQEVCAATDVDCLEVSTALLKDATEAQVAAKVNVPLSLLHLVDRDLAVVEHTATRVLEGSSFR